MVIHNNPQDAMLFFIAFNGFISVSMGAFGAHGLRKLLSSVQLQWWQTASLYLMVHTLAALGAWIILKLQSPQIQIQRVKYALCMFLIGNFLFAGSLYTLSLTQIKILGMITPIGGACYLIGWTLLGLCVKTKSSDIKG